MFVQPLVYCCLVILVLTSSDVGVMVDCVVLKYAQQRTRVLNLFGLFVLSPCDGWLYWVLSPCGECVVANQNVFLGPTIPQLGHGTSRSPRRMLKLHMMLSDIIKIVKRN